MQISVKALGLNPRAEKEKSEEICKRLKIVQSQSYEMKTGNYNGEGKVQNRD